MLPVNVHIMMRVGMEVKKKKKKADAHFVTVKIKMWRQLTEF